MRIGIIALQHESNTFAARATNLADFESDHVLVGEAIRDFMGNAHHEVGGFFEGLSHYGVEAAPVFSARALPGGSIEYKTFQTLIDRMFEAFDRAGPLDGILVAPHGAAVSEGHLDADGFWLSQLRERVGSIIPIVCTLDPHANLSTRMADACQATIAYRTNPHVDQRDRGIEAATLIVRTLRGEIRPRQAAVLLPLIINIERQRTQEQPCLGFQQRADQIRRQPGVLSASIVLGFPYADVPEMGSAAIVVTNADQASPEAFADALATSIWDRREDCVGIMIDADEALRQVDKCAGPVLLLDMGDNVGGGGPGDGTTLAHALDRWGAGEVLMTICDPESVRQAAQAGAGASLRLAIGGKTDSRHGEPFLTDVQVLSLHNGQFRETQVRHGGWADFDMGQVAIVQTRKRMTLMLTSRRLFPVSAMQWTSFGIDPSKYRVIVAKGVHAPVAAYEEICPRLIRINTPGVTTADMLSLEYRHRRKPLFPFEREAIWQGRVS